NGYGASDRRWWPAEKVSPCPRVLGTCHGGISPAGALGELFRADARSSYQLYSRDVVRREEQLPPRHQRWQTVKAFFWSVVMKLSPARRVILLLALLFLVLPTFEVESQNGHLTVVTFGSGFAAVLLLLLLVLEIADRVTMKRDLEI